MAQPFFQSGANTSDDGHTILRNDWHVPVCIGCGKELGKGTYWENAREVAKKHQRKCKQYQVLAAKGY